MKRKIIAVLLALTLVVSQFSPVTAAWLDTNTYNDSESLSDGSYLRLETDPEADLTAEPPSPSPEMDSLEGESGKYRSIEGLFTESLVVPEDNIKDGDQEYADQPGRVEVLLKETPETSAAMEIPVAQTVTGSQVPFIIPVATETPAVSVAPIAAEAPIVPVTVVGNTSQGDPVGSVPDFVTDGQIADMEGLLAEAPEEAAVEDVARLDTPAIFAVDDNGVLTAYYGSGGEIVIPANVVEIGERVFYNNTNITKVTFNQGLKKIGDYAFYNCTQLKGTLDIPETVTNIGTYAFYGCSGFTGDLIIPDSVISLGSGAFFACQGFNGNIKLSKNLTRIYDETFCSMTNVKGTLTIPDNVTTIDRWAFGYMFSVKSVVFGRNLKIIDLAAFEGYSEVEEITLLSELVPEGIAAISSFSNLKIVWVANELYDVYSSILPYMPEDARIITTDSGIESDFVISADGVLLKYIGDGGEIVIPEGVTEIGANVFRSNLDITKVTFNTGLEKIGEYAFYECRQLTGSLDIPETVTSIGSHAFYYCSGLRGDLIIPDSVSFLGSYAFYYCYGFNGGITLSKNLTRIYEYTFYSVYNVRTALTIPDNVTLIDDNAFNNLFYIEHITFGRNLITINSNNFYGSGRVEEVTFLSTSVPEGAGTISGFTGLKRVSVPRKSYDAYYSSLLPYAVEGASIIAYGDPDDFVVVDGVLLQYTGTSSYVVVPDGVVEIGTKVFYYNTNVKKVTFNQGLKRIGEGAFQGSGLSDVPELPETLESIGDSAFIECGEMAGILAIPGSVTSLGNYAFAECWDLRGLRLNEGLLTIGTSAFRSGSNMRGSLVIPETVTSIGAESFAFCMGFTGDLIIPDSVSFLGSYAFGNCSGFNGSIKLSRKMTSINPQSFWGVSNVKGTLIIPDLVKNIGEGAFEGMNSLNAIIFGKSLTTIDNYYSTPGYTGVEEVRFLSRSVPNGVSIISLFTNLKQVMVPKKSYEAYYSGLLPYLAEGVSLVADDGDDSDTGDFVIADGVLIEYIGDGGYIAIPENVTEIADRVFYNNLSITEVAFNSGLKKIGDYAFYGCSQLTGSLVIPETVNSIGSYAFYRCSGFSGNLIIPDSVNFIGSDAFYYCWNFDDDIKLSGNLTRIYENTFAYLYNVRDELIIPDKITEIDNNAFANMLSIRYVTFGRNLTTIDNNAFSGSDYVQEIMFLSKEVPNGISFVSSFYNLKQISVPKKSYDAYCLELQPYMPIGARIVANGDPDDFVIADGVLVQYTGDSGVVVIPDGVIEIGASAFYNNTSLTKVIFNQDLKKIGDKAFQFAGLTGVLELPAALESIGDNAFSDCGRLTGILVIPDSVKSLGDYAFAWCWGLSGLMLNEGLVTIGDSAFSSCYNIISSLIIPKTVTSIGNDAFAYCSGFTGDLIIPDSVNFLGSYAFNGSGFNGSIKLSEKLTILNSYTFANTSNIIGTLTIPANITDVDSSAFNNMTGIDSIVFIGEPSISSYSFLGLSDVESVTFKSLLVPPISANAFYWLTGLKYIYVPQAAYSDYAQVLSPLLSSSDIQIISENDKEFEIHDGVLFRYTGSGGVVTIPENVTEISNSAFFNNVNITKVIFNSGLKKIGHSAFAGTKLTGVLEMPETLESIGNNAFRNCAGLTGVKLKAGLKSVGENAFRDCSKLTGILEIPGTVLSLENYAFYGCSSLTGLKLNEGLETIGASAFANCKKVTGMLEIPGSVTNIENNTFYRCSALTGLVLNEGLKRIGESAFMECKKMTGMLEIPGSVTNIEYNAFYSCSSLTSLKLNEGLLTIGMQAFRECSNFKGSLVIPDSVTSIENTAFYNCSGFTGDLIIPDSVISLGSSVFNGCSGFNGIIKLSENLTRIYDNIFYRVYEVTGTLTVPDKVTVIDGGAFNSMRSLKAIVLGRNLTTIGNVAFTGCSSVEEITFLNTVVPSGLITFSQLTNLKLVRVPKASYDAYREGLLPYIPADARIITDEEVPEVPEPEIPEKVTGLSYTAAQTAVELSWDSLAASDIDFYRVERQTGADTFTTVGDVTSGTSLSISGLQTDTEYLFRVVAYDKAGNRGVPSDVLTVRTTAEPEVPEVPEPEIPEKVTGLNAAATINGGVLKWNAIENENFSHFVVEQKNPGSTTFAALGNTVQTQFTVNKLAADAEYSFRVRAVDKLGNQGPYSDELVFSTPFDQEPQVTSIVPANGTLLSGVKQISVVASHTVALDSISLQASSDSGESWVTLGAIDVPENAAQYTAVFSVDTKLFSDGGLLIRAFAVNTADRVSSGYPLRQYTVDNTAPAKVANLWAESVSTKITLHWDDVSDNDLDYFLVEQKIGENFLQIAKISNKLGCVADRLEPEKEYTFRVAAVDKAGNVGDHSDIVISTTTEDIYPPVIVSINPKSARYSSEINISAVAGDDYKVANIVLESSRDRINWQKVTETAAIVPGAAVTLSYKLDVSALEEGSLYIRAIAEDLAGNKSVSDDTAPFVEYMIDHTPPLKPSGLALSTEVGYINLEWSQGSEADLGGYNVYRSVGNSENFVLLASGLRTINYVDRSVEADLVYYYRTNVSDTAGNISEFSDVVFGSMKPDTISPEMYSISPKTGDILGKTANIGVWAADNGRLSKIIAEYKTDGSDVWLSLGEYSTSASSGTASFTLNTAGIGEKAITVRAKAVDSVGNESEYMEASYTIDLTPPMTPFITVNPESMSLSVSWTSAGEEDLNGFKVYRKVDDQSSYTYVAQRAKGSLIFLDNSVDVTKKYSYKVEAHDKAGNISYSESDFYAPINDDEEAPEAVINAPDQGEAGIALIFDGSYSMDNVGVYTYLWDFGDGETSAKATASHIFMAAGTYKVKLTVRDFAGNEDSSQVEIVIFADGTLGGARIRVLDDLGAPVNGANIYVNLGSSNQEIITTGADGVAILRRVPGKYIVGAYKSGYLPAKKDVTIHEGITLDYTFNIKKSDIVAGDLTWRRMTLDEVKAAGIDVYAPENQNVFKFEIHLVYMDTPLVVNGFGNGGGIGGFGGGGTGGNTSWTDVSFVDSSGGSHTLQVITVPTGEAQKPLIFIMDIPGEATWLKDFFEVRLFLLNMADPEFRLDDCSATLNFEDGLTLMKNTAYGANSARVDFGPVRGGESKEIFWILRGDKAGSYDLSADFSAVLAEFNEPISAKFVAKDPVKVDLSQGLVMDIEVEKEILPGKDSAIRVGITNEGAEDVYLPNINLEKGVLDVSYKTVHATGALLPNDKAPRETLKPGETIWWAYTLPIRYDDDGSLAEDGDFNGFIAPGEMRFTKMYLVEAALRAMGGNAELPYRFTEVPAMSINGVKLGVYDASGAPLSSLKFKPAEGDSTVRIPDIYIQSERLDDYRKGNPADGAELWIKDKSGIAYAASFDENGHYVLAAHDVEFSGNSNSYELRIYSRRGNDLIINVEISGDFGEVPEPEVYTITASAGTGGAITPSGVIMVEAGDPATFGIIADEGYKISYVLVDGTSMGAINTYTFDNVSTNHAIEATFEKMETEPEITEPEVPEPEVYTITASAGTGGAITPSGVIMVEAGDPAAFGIIANEGYKVSYVLVDGVSMGAINTYTFDNVSTNHAIAAMFEKVETEPEIPEPEVPEVSAEVANGVIKATFANGSTEMKSGQLMVSVYNTSGKMVKMKSVAFNIQAKGNAVLEMDLEDAAAGYRYQVMAWDNNFVPLTGTAGGLLQ